MSLSGPIHSQSDPILIKYNQGNQIHVGNAQECHSVIIENYNSREIKMLVSQTQRKRYIYIYICVYLNMDRNKIDMEQFK